MLSIALKAGICSTTVFPAVVNQPNGVELQLIDQPGRVLCGNALITIIQWSTEIVIQTFFGRSMSAVQLLPDCGPHKCSCGWRSRCCTTVMCYVLHLGGGRGGGRVASWFVLHTKSCSGDPIMEDEIGKSCSMHGVQAKCVYGFGWKLDVTIPLGRPGITGE